MKLFEILTEELTGLKRPQATYRPQPDDKLRYKKWYPQSRSKEDKETWSRDQAIAKHNERLVNNNDLSPKVKKEKVKKGGMDTFKPSQNFLRPPPREGNRN